MRRLHRLLMSRTGVLITRLVLSLLGMTAPGLLLALDPARWLTTVALMSALKFSLLGVRIVGIGIGLAGLVAAFWTSYRDFAFAMGSVFYLVAVLAYAIEFFSGKTIGVLVLAFIVLAWIYAEESVAATHIDEKSPRIKRG